jgi:pyruvate dehydrogenase E2 component (dihydrolipoamide acetyltransferase)
MLVGPADIELTDQMIDAAKGSALAQPTQQQPQIKQEPITSAPNVKTPVAGTKIIASPRAKKLAKTLALDISTISGTGPAGRIIEKDVKAADKNASAAAPKGDIKLGQRIPMTKMQKITGQRMLESKRDIPCFYLTAKADMTELVHYRAAVNLKAETKVAFNDFIIKAVAMALEKFPIMTGQLEGDNIRTVDTINVGLAMAVDDGLIVPVIKNIENKNIIQVAADSKTLITKAKTNKLKLTDLEEGSFTVSNLGAFGIDSFIPIVVPGQCCIMGVGQIADSCVPLKGGIMIRKIMSMTISVDHRVANGAYAAQFLDYIRKILENPENFK